MDTLSYKTVSGNKETADKKWFIVDAENQTVGRLSSQVAKVLRGKHKILHNTVYKIAVKFKLKRLWLFCYFYLKLKRSLLKKGANNSEEIIGIILRAPA